MTDDHAELLKRLWIDQRDALNEEYTSFAETFDLAARAIEALVAEQEQIGMASHKIGWRVGREAGIREAAAAVEEYNCPQDPTDSAAAILSLIDKPQENEDGRCR